MKYSAKGLLTACLLPLGLVSHIGAAQSIEHSTGQSAAFGQQLIIDDIVCEGNVTTECDFITKKYYQNIGDILNPDEIADAKLRLGTLFQFKTINTRLAKGARRGHVVVIFEVQEAQNIQYQLNGGYSASKISSNEPFCYENNFITDIYRSCSETNGDFSGPSFGASVIDFNFLGSGKQLSFGVSTSKWQEDYTSTTITQRNEEPQQRYIRGSDADTNNYSASLEYYDPHLFDTSLYYFRARVSYQRSRYSPNLRISSSQSQSNEPSGNLYANSTPFHFEVGRRFGSYSYISFDVGGYFEDTDETQGVGINYGWDSQDDSLFPTKGSVFSSTFRFKPERLDEGTLGFGYAKHFELAENNIFTFGGSSQYTRINQAYGTAHQFSGNLNARFTNITAVDKLAGTYMGWFVEGNIGATTSSDYNPRQFEYGVRAGYTYQSDSMIYRFSLGLNHQEIN